MRQTAQKRPVVYHFAAAAPTTLDRRQHPPRVLLAHPAYVARLNSFFVPSLKRTPASLASIL